MKIQLSRIDWRAASLLVPALVFSAGAIAYLGEVFFPGALTQHEARRWGTWLMVVGSEGGSLPAMVEVWRKVALGRARWYDYVGTVVSTVTTMLGFVIVWAREHTGADYAWMEFVRQWGPLAALPLSVLDFVFGCGLELGTYDAGHREEARQAALQDKRDELGFERANLALEAERMALTQTAAGNELANLRRQNGELLAALETANADLDAIDRQSSATAPATTAIDPPQTATVAQGAGDGAPRRRMTAQEWREIPVIDKPTTASAVNRWLEDNGYEPVPATTARRWAKS